MKKIVIVAPTFNEDENISLFLTAVVEESKKISGYEVETVISDSHSEDQTSIIVRQFSAKNPKIHYFDTGVKGPGKLGQGLQMGLDYAVNKLHADILVTMEADLSNNPNQLSDFAKKIMHGADLVVGSRYVKGGAITNWSWWRKFLSRIANIVLMVLAFTLDLHEFTNLYRMFKKEVWQDLKPKIKMRQGWLFVPAFIFEALQTDFKIMEQPIIYFDRFGGRSKMNTLRYTRNLMIYALKFRLHKSASVFKFGVVGGLGFLINTIILIAGVNLGLLPSTAGPIGAEVAIIVGFFLNNYWTFVEDRLTSLGQFLPKFLQYNVIAFGSVVIQFLFLRTGEFFFGLTRFKGPIINFPIIRLYSWYMFFYMAGVGVGMVWNYIMYRKVVWKKNDKTSEKS